MKSNTPQPPKKAQRLFCWLAGPALVEDLVGDLDELFFMEVRETSVVRAHLNYWRRIVVLGLSYAVRSRRKDQSIHPFSSSASHLTLLLSHLRVAYRSLVRDRFFASMNIVGLATGMSISLLLLALLSYVSTYDTFHAKRDSIYRIITHTDGPEGSDDWASSPALLYDQLNGNLAGIQGYVRMQAAEVDVAIETEKIPLRGFYANPDFLKTFTFPLLRGNPGTALTKPNTLLLTAAASQKLFGSNEPFGKVVEVNGIPFEVTGILDDHPRNSHLHFEIILSYATIEGPAKSIDPSMWSQFIGSYQYLWIPGKATEVVEDRLAKIAAANESSNAITRTHYSLQPLNDIVPGPDLRNSAGPSWDLLGMSIFFVLTLLILLPACANYAMIALSRAMRRMKEIGIRKTIGSTRSQIIWQFLAEGVLVAMAALALSSYFFVLVRNEFLGMLVYGRESLDLSITPMTAAVFVTFALLVGLLSGIVPGLHFAKITPLLALQSKSTGHSRGRFSFRKSMLVVQFALSLGFIMAVVIVFSQYRKTLQYNFGFRQSNVLDVPLQGVDPARVQVAFSRLSAVESMSLSSHVIGTQFPDETVVRTQDGDSSLVFGMSVDSGYIATLGLRLVAGRNFDHDPAIAARSLIVNEQFTKHFGFTNPVDAIGKSFFVRGKELTVTGVAADFHYMTLREPIHPFLFACNPSRFTTVNLKLSTADPLETMERLEGTWASLGSEKKFVARFLDDEIEEAYSFYFTLIKICGILGLLAVSISCLGLLGMVVFTVQTRVKEIAIRKIMGSTTQKLVLLLSWDYARLMLLGFVIAAPLTYLFMDKGYLRMSQSRIPISVMDIAVSLLLLLTLGLVTILSQTIKASSGNPVDSLRHE